MKHKIYDKSEFSATLELIYSVYPSISTGWGVMLVGILSKDGCSPDDLKQAIEYNFKYSDTQYPLASEIIKKTIEIRNKRWQREEHSAEQPYTPTEDELEWLKSRKNG